MTTDPAGAAPIRTPDQRLRVFVSSTLAELAPERAAVARAISAPQADAGDVRARSPAAPSSRALPRLPGAVRRVRRSLLAALRMDRPRDGHLGTRRRVPPVRRDAPAAVHEVARSRAGAAIGGDDRRPPVRGRRLLPIVPHHARARPARAQTTWRSSSASGSRARGSAAALSTAPVDTEVRPPRRSLPTPSTSLIGRENDIAEVSSLLESPEVRLVTLTGPGGIGKTRLAIAVGAALAEAGRRTEFVSLASITDPALVLPRVAAAVGAPIEGTRSALDTLIEHFALTPTLLVLDNFEQVTGAATELDQLLGACPGVTILATSRTLLRLSGERDYPVGPLSVPAFAEPPPLEEVSALPAVRLFVDRARAVRHDFTLDDTNAAAVAEICRRLDGLPLAIELAAARTRVLRPTALLDRLEHVLDALGTGPRDLPERQRTLRATVEWSFGLLDDQERELVEALSVFADGWTLDAATRVVRPDGGRDAGPSRRARRPQSRQRRRRRHRTALPHACDGARARGRAARRGRRRRRRRTAHTPATSPSSWRTPAGRRNARSSGPTGWASRRRTCAFAIRWFFTHDITPLPHMFRVLWLFWQMRDRMREGRDWMDELRLRADSLDEHSRVEVLVHVGGDVGRGGRRHERARCHRRHRGARRAGRRSRPAERSGAGRRLDGADPRRLRRRASPPHPPLSTASASATNRSSPSPS